MTDHIDQFVTEYAALRQAYIDAMPVSYSQEPLTAEQLEIARRGKATDTADLPLFA